MRVRRIVLAVTGVLGCHSIRSRGPRDHIHVACLRCGKVREFESGLYEKLKRQIERECGIRIQVSRTEVGGYCDSCRTQKPS